jgi:hypothetical protein
VAYLEALFAAHASYALSMALAALTVFALAAVTAAVGRERRGVVFGAARPSPAASLGR